MVSALTKYLGVHGGAPQASAAAGISLATT
jgi:hypothetical protein